MDMLLLTLFLSSDNNNQTNKMEGVWSSETVVTVFDWVSFVAMLPQYAYGYGAKLRFVAIASPRGLVSSA